MNISPNTGTTFTSKNIVIPIATSVTAVGYIIADFTFFRRRAVFSRYVASRPRISASNPPFSPAAVIE